MGHKGGQDDGRNDHHPALARLFGQEVDDGVEQADLIHQSEVRDGENEQHRCAEHGLHAGTDEAADLLGTESGGDGCDQGQTDEGDRGADPAFDQKDHQHGHQNKTNQRKHMYILQFGK